MKTKKIKTTAHSIMCCHFD